jgi:hypothetical protein
MPKLIWAEDREAAVEDVAELDAILDRLTVLAGNGQPFIVELVTDDGSTMSMGLGLPQSVLSYLPGSLNPPYMESFAGAGDEALAFYYRGELSEFSPETAIPVEQARDALRYFLKTQLLSDNVNWRET